MIRTVATVAVMTIGSLALVGSAQAAAGGANREADGMGQFYATPIQKGVPEDLPGERLIPGATVAAHAIDVVVSPALEPISQIGTTVGGTIGTVVAVGAPAPAPAAEPMMMRHRHHHHHYMMRKHHMMKKKMMMK